MLSPVLFQLAMFLLAALSVGGLLLAAYYPRLAGDRKFAGRLASVTGHRKMAKSGGGSAEERRMRAVELTLHELDAKQKAKSRRRGKPTLTNRMRQAGLTWSQTTYFIFCGGAALICFALVLSLFGVGLLPALGFAVAGGLLVPHLYVSSKRNRRFKGFAAEFPNALDVVVRGVKTGLPLVDCLKIIASEAQEPVKREFNTVIEDQTVGVPLNDAVERLAERMPIAEANFFAIVIAIQTQTGGSLSGALGNLSIVLRERKKMKGKIKAMSSEAKSSAGIIGAIPFVVSGILFLVAPDYISLLFTTPTGNLVLGISAFWMLLGVMVMRKMINFDF